MNVDEMNRVLLEIVNGDNIRVEKFEVKWISRDEYDRVKVTEDKDKEEFQGYTVEDMLYELTCLDGDVYILPTGERVRMYMGEDSVYHDGGPLSRIVEIEYPDGTQRLFIDRGTHSSWDSNYWDDDWSEVVRKTRMVEEVYYEKV